MTKHFCQFSITMNTKSLLPLIIFLYFCGRAEPYKILAICPAPPYSHFTLCFRLVKELVDRGHQVTLISMHPQKTPIQNLTDVPIKEVNEQISSFFGSLQDFGTLSYLQQLEWVKRLGITQSRAILQHENVKKLLKSNEKFDLVILHHFFNDALAVFAHKFNCPLLIFSPFSLNIFNNYILRNPAPYSYVINFLADYESNMNFWERLENTYSQIIGELFVQWRIISAQNEILQQEYPGAPDLASILHNTSFILSVTHLSLADSLPLQQNIKEIGGYHVIPPKKLPKDLQDFMDNSPEGVVVFSMGSNLKSANFEPKKRTAILNAFSKIKQKVLWKFEADLPDKPDTVKILKWLPQSDVLAHPNTVAFISHGGLLGTTEAVYHGVPILGLPVFWDQTRNIATCVRKGFALKIDFHNLKEESFSEALIEILENPKYKNIAKQRSVIMHDVPTKQMDEAMFWIEYVIRHKGAPHLRSPAMDLKWYQLYLLDIILFISTIFIVILTSLYYIFIYFFCKKHTIKKNKKNQ